MSLEMSLKEVFKLHPLPWKHECLIIRDANTRQVIHLGGSTDQYSKTYPGEYLSALNALLVQAANATLLSPPKICGCGMPEQDEIHSSYAGDFQSDVPYFQQPHPFVPPQDNLHKPTIEERVLRLETMAHPPVNVVPIVEEMIERRLSRKGHPNHTADIGD